MVHMTSDTLKKIVALGVVTGMRSIAGLAALASTRRGVARPAMALAAMGEMIADKTPWVGDRIDLVPLAGRAIMGAVVGGAIAGERDENALLGGALGAATALVASHLAYQARKRMPLSSIAGGLLEDSLVIAIATRYA
jgi:uncharacterized membrane protein